LHFAGQEEPMIPTRHAPLPVLVLLAAACAAEKGSAPGGADSALPSDPGSPAAPQAYVLAADESYAVEFVATAADGIAMNAAGDVLGASYTDPGCGPWCLPPLETVVWQGGDRLVVPVGLGSTLRSIDGAGALFGSTLVAGLDSHATRWDPTGAGYTTLDLGVLPGTTTSAAIGSDDLGRVVGWSTTTNFPPTGAPFLWTAAGGMVDLAAQGFPAEAPLAISPGGMVATAGYWYDLDDPASVTALSVPPPGYLVTSQPAVINDSGAQARFLVSTGASNLSYLYRYHPDGTWQQLSATGTGSLASYGVGGIDVDGTVVGTVLGGAVVAWGPDGVAETLADRVSPAYDPGGLTVGGPPNDAGEVLGELIIGASARLVRLVPVTPCTIDCAVVDRIAMSGRFVEDPADPGQCGPNVAAYNLSAVKVKVTDEAGLPLAGVEVLGRFLDDYWTDEPVADTTNSRGIAKFVHRGLCGVGTVAFVVDDVVAPGRDLDRTTGTLVASTIPN
jgi:hypothetical protein